MELLLYGLQQWSRWCWIWLSIVKSRFRWTLNSFNFHSFSSSFSHILDFPEGTSVIPQKQAGVEIFSCNDDYIAVNSIRLCGEKLNDASRTDDLTVNAMITDTTNGLNVIPVRTNAAAVGRGFRINFIQIPCDEQPVTMEPAPIETTEQPAPEENTPPDSKYKRKRTVHNWRSERECTFPFGWHNPDIRLIWQICRIQCGKVNICWLA